MLQYREASLPSTDWLVDSMRLAHLTQSGAIHFVQSYHPQGSVQCLQFDESKIVSGSWDTTCIVGECQCVTDVVHEWVSLCCRYGMWFTGQSFES